MVAIENKQYVLPLELADRRHGDRRQHPDSDAHWSAQMSRPGFNAEASVQRRLVNPRPAPLAAFLAQEIAQDLQPAVKSSPADAAASGVRHYQVSMGDDVTIEGPVRDIRLKI